jgi:hypothetical protein
MSIEFTSPPDSPTKDVRVVILRNARPDVLASAPTR